MSKPTDEQLRAAAYRSYGTPCSQNFCQARGDRGLCLDSNLQPARDEEAGGTWVTARIWISDEDAIGGAR